MTNSLGYYRGQFGIEQKVKLDDLLSPSKLVAFYLYKEQEAGNPLYQESLGGGPKSWIPPEEYLKVGKLK